MSGDIITTFFDVRRDRWRLLWGNETFYDESRRMIEFDDEEVAYQWCKENCGRWPTAAPAPGAARRGNLAEIKREMQDRLQW